MSPRYGIVRSQHCVRTERHVAVPYEGGLRFVEKTIPPPPFGGPPPFTQGRLVCASETARGRSLREGFEVCRKDNPSTAVRRSPSLYTRDAKKASPNGLPFGLAKGVNCF